MDSGHTTDHSCLCHCCTLSFSFTWSLHTDQNKHVKVQCTAYWYSHTYSSYVSMRMYKEHSTCPLTLHTKWIREASSLLRPPAHPPTHLHNHPPHDYVSVYTHFLCIPACIVLERAKWSSLLTSMYGIPMSESNLLHSSFCCLVTLICNKIQTIACSDNRDNLKWANTHTSRFWNFSAPSTSPTRVQGKVDSDSGECTYQHGVHDLP